MDKIKHVCRKSIWCQNKFSQMMGVCNKCGDCGRVFDSKGALIAEFRKEVAKSEQR